MIYRHYKGGLYFVEGYATPFSNKFHDKNIVTIEVVAKAKYEPTLNEVEIVLVHDKSVGGTYYAYRDDSIEGVMVFYRGVDGQNWLRPRESFSESIKMTDRDFNDQYDMPRFEKVSGEYLFDTISELIRKLTRNI